jgi:hypothetical protein
MFKNSAYGDAGLQIKTLFSLDFAPQYLLVGHPIKGLVEGGITHQCINHHYADFGSTGI